MAISSLALIPSFAEEPSPKLFVDVVTEDEGVKATVQFTGEKKIDAIQFFLYYDPNVLHYETGTLQGAYQNMIGSVNVDLPGRIGIAAVSSEGIVPEQNVFTADFSFVKTVPDLHFILGEVIILDEEGKEYLLQEEPFSDVSESWANNEIVQACGMGFMDGYGGGIFAPEDSLTRAQMAQILWNYAGNPSANFDAPFTDLEQDWYREAVNWAYGEKIFYGVGENRFDPEGILTREQLAQLLFNQSGQQKGMEGMLTGIYDGQYPDSSEISNWAKDAFYWALYKGILCGSSSEEIGNTLYPKAPASRAQAAVMMVRYHELQAGNL